MEYQIAKYLEDNNVASPFVNYRPDNNDTLTSIYSESVPQPDFVQGFANDYIGIKFLTRGKNQQETRSLAWSIHKKLAQLGGVEITSQGETAYVVSVDIVNPPTFLEVDEKGRIVFVSHYSVHGETQGNKFRRNARTLSIGDPELLETFDSTFDETYG